MKTGVVKEFRGEYSFLSNYYHNPFTWRSIVFPTGDNRIAAATFWDMFHSYIMTGFTEEQAMSILQSIIHAGVLGNTLNHPEGWS